MRPATVHALAQMIRHSRGLVTTVEKWVGATPPEELPGEVADVIGYVRGALTELNTALASLRLEDVAPRPASAATTTDRSAE